MKTERFITRTIDTTDVRLTLVNNKSLEIMENYPVMLPGDFSKSSEKDLLKVVSKVIETEEPGFIIVRVDEIKVISKRYKMSEKAFIENATEF